MLESTKFSLLLKCQEHKYICHIILLPVVKAEQKGLWWKGQRICEFLSVKKKEYLDHSSFSGLSSLLGTLDIQDITKESESPK